MWSVRPRDTLGALSITLVLAAFCGSNAAYVPTTPSRSASPDFLPAGAGLVAVPSKWGAMSRAVASQPGRRPPRHATPDRLAIRTTVLRF